MKVWISILCLLLFVQVHWLLAQHTTDTRGQSGRFSPQFTFQSWKRSSNQPLPENVKKDMRQIAVPLLISYPISRELKLSVMQTGAVSEIRASEDRRLEGFDDTRIQMSYLTANRRLLLVGRFHLPTGNTLSTADELELASALYSDVLSFNVIRYGEGFNARGEALLAQRIGSLGLAIGGGYLYRGSYETLFADQKTTWDPEDEIRFRGGINLIKRHFAWHSGGTYIRFVDNGNQTTPKLQDAFFVQNHLAHTSAKFLLSVDTSALFRNAEIDYNLPRTIYAGQFTGQYILNRRIRLQGTAGVKHIPDEGTTEAKAWLYSFGGGTQIRIVSGIKLDVAIQMSMGHETIHQNNKAFEVDLRGLHIRAGISGFFGTPFF